MGLSMIQLKSSIWKTCIWHSRCSMDGQSSQQKSIRTHLIL